jgi:adenylate kinase
MIIVMGLPGAGKSTVLSAAKKTDYSIVNYGDLMFEIASKEAGIKHRDELRRLDTATQKRVQSAVGKALAAMKGRIILDTHCSISTPKGYLPGLPYSLLSGLKVEYLVLITAPVEEIIGRRTSDATRARDAESPESLSEHDAMNRSYLAAYSCLTGAPAAIISNRNNALAEAQGKLLSILA